MHRFKNTSYPVKSLLWIAFCTLIFSQVSLFDANHNHLASFGILGLVFGIVTSCIATNVMPSLSQTWQILLAYAGLVYGLMSTLLRTDHESILQDILAGLFVTSLVILESYIYEYKRLNRKKTTTGGENE